jgi:hypothetical protein
MTTRAALVLGLCLVFAALVHGGIYGAGHDFIVNRFTGEYVFVPSEDEAAWNVPTGLRTLTCSGADDRVARLTRRR